MKKYVKASDIGTKPLFVQELQDVIHVPTKLRITNLSDGGELSYYSTIDEAIRDYAGCIVRDMYVYNNIICLDVICW